MDRDAQTPDPGLPCANSAGAPSGTLTAASRGRGPSPTTPAIAGLTPVQTKALDGHLRAIDEAKGAMVSGALKIGEHLDAVHKLLKGAGRDGSFLPWITENCGFSKTAAYRYLSAYSVFGKCPTVGHFSDSAMYVLASDSTPEEAAQEAIKLAKRGHRITEAKAKEIVAKVRAKFAEQGANGEDPAEPAGGEPKDNSAIEAEGHRSVGALEAPPLQPAAKPVSPPPLDQVDGEIPEHLRAAFAQGVEFDQLVRDLQSIKSRAEALAGGPIGEFLHAQEVAIQIDNAKNELKGGRPYAVCPHCKGSDRKQRNCTQCRKQGWMPKLIYERTSQQMRA